MEPAKKIKIKDDFILRNEVWSDTVFDKKKNTPGVFFAVEAEELHPNSVVPNFLPDVEHRCYTKSKVTIKVEGSPTTAELFPTGLDTLQKYRLEHLTKDNKTTIVRGCKEHLKNRFCKYSYNNKHVFTVRAANYKSSVFNLVVLLGNHNGILYKGSNEHRNNHYLKVGCWVPNGMRSAMKNVS
jgi:hypothetical protein